MSEAKELVKRYHDSLSKKVDQKTSWGKNELRFIMTDTLNEELMRT